MPMPYALPFLMICVLIFSPALAKVKSDVGFDYLQTEMGENLPDGQGVPVSQVEAASDGHWMPDTTNAEFTGKTIVDMDSDSGFSAHATSAGKHLYGNASAMAPGIDTIRVYYASDWLQSSYLGALGWGSQPLYRSSRIANHSWVSTLPVTYTADILRRVDWVVDTDEEIQVVGLNNGSIHQELLSHGFNVIAVGRTDANHPCETLAVDDDYVAGRTLPTLVVPMATTSYATPVVASAAVLLIAAGHETLGLSTDSNIPSTNNRNGDLIYNAERSEVLKAALMSGADRFTQNTNTGDIWDYRASTDSCTANGLDRRYGAGQLNVYNASRLLLLVNRTALKTMRTVRAGSLFRALTTITVLAARRTQTQQRPII